ncbi:Mrp/NBP35 family ATP-binding protein [Fundidesulfovibrio terrae]|uniref:Mrp/NBP35 family ATP-binding protein n=1 Tax=Fundidesulfovibrio terrae TaxID=2922866 RepID=UPI001FAFFC2B|nr:Mrp/NBP35 family ATP-binding protein [Fundidesulfovibrio terrae]
MNQSPSGDGANESLQPLEIPGAIARIKSKIVVLSGKGGVGKSTVAANLAAGLALEGLRTGLLDVDVHGPSIPRIMGLAGVKPEMAGDAILPVEWNWNLKVVSMGFFLANPDEAVIWRGPVKGGVIKQFLTQVAWGDLDCLVVDCPPGTGDEPLSVLQMLGEDATALVVTSPQDVAIDDVRRSIGFCRELGNPVLGIVENLSGFHCPQCGTVHDIFKSGGGERLAESAGVPFLGRIPIDGEVGRAADQGEAYLAVKGTSPAASAFKRVVAAAVRHAAGRGREASGDA